jgi:hypothetical protein
MYNGYLASLEASMPVSLHRLHVEKCRRILLRLVGFVPADNVPAEVAAGSRIGQVRCFAEECAQQVERFVRCRHVVVVIVVPTNWARNMRWLRPITANCTQPNDALDANLHSPRRRPIHSPPTRIDVESTAHRMSHT